MDSIPNHERRPGMNLSSKVIMGLLVVIAILIFVGLHHGQSLNYERTRQYSDVIPIGVPLKVQVCTKFSLSNPNSTTSGQPELMRPYRNIVLRWKTEGVYLFAVIREQEVAEERPEWFAQFLAHDGKEYTIPKPKEQK